MAETQTEMILHPVRMRIVMTLSRRHLTTQQIGAALPDVAQATLYRHLNRLLKAGTISVIDQRPVRGVMEKVYAVAGDGVSLSIDPLHMTATDWERGFAAFTASLMGQFGAYISSEQANPVADGVSFRTAPLYLSDAETKQFFADLYAVIVPALSRGPAPGRRRRLLSTALVPDTELAED